MAVRLPAHASLLLTVIGNPLWIALTALGRWVSDQYGSSTASHDQHVAPGCGGRWARTPAGNGSGS